MTDEIPAPALHTKTNLSTAASHSQALARQQSMCITPFRQYWVLRVSPHGKAHDFTPSLSRPTYILMKHTPLLLVALSALVVVSCDEKKEAINANRDATKEAIDKKKDAVDEAAKDAKKQVEANVKIDKANIEASKEATQAQLDADKKKADAAAAAAKTQVDAEKK